MSGFQKELKDIPTDNINVHFSLKLVENKLQTNFNDQPADYEDTNPLACEARIIL